MRTIYRKAYVAGATDRHGNPAKQYATPVPLDVLGVAPRASLEPVTGRYVSVDGLTVLCPAGTVLDPRDLVVIDDEDYEVDGPVQDWSHGPFGYEAGVTFDVTRTEG